MNVRRTYSNTSSAWSVVREELAHYVMDETEAKSKSLETLNNEQLIRVYHGEPLSVVISQ